MDVSEEKLSLLVNWKCHSCKIEVDCNIKHKMIIDTNTAIAQDVTLVVKWPPIMSHYFWQLCQTFLIAGRSGGQRLSRFFDRGVLRTKGLFVDTPAHCNLYMDKSNQIGSPMISLSDGDEWPSREARATTGHLDSFLSGKAERARRLVPN